MVEEIEKLQSHTPLPCFLAWNFCVFHDGEIHVDKSRSTKVIATLRKRNAVAAARAGGPGQITRVKSCLAPGLDKKGRGIRRPVAQHLRRQAGCDCGRNCCPFTTL